MKKLHLVAIALIALCSGFILSWQVYDSRPVTLETGHWFADQAIALPEFQLLDHDNQSLGHAQLTGKWSLLFFGYTNCPDICPTSLQTLSEMMNAIDDPDVKNAVQVIFVSVDPDRDLPEVLKTYVHYFNDDFIGATAPLVDLNRLTHVLGIAHSRDQSSENQAIYDVSHSSAIILISPDVSYAGLFGAPHDASAMARDLVKIVERN
jgi:protein SCO1/2